MQRTTVAVLTAAALGVTLLSGCAVDDDDDNPCGGQPIVYVEADDDETEYHCGSATGMVVPLVLIDSDTRAKAKSSPGKPVQFKPAPAPKVNVNKPAPAPKVNVNKPATGKR